MSDKADFTVGVCVGVLTITLLAKLVDEIFPPLGDTLKKQAIERGHAEYVVDSDGKTTWRWKEAK